MTFFILEKHCVHNLKPVHEDPIILQLHVKANCTLHTTLGTVLGEEGIPQIPSSQVEEKDYVSYSEICTGGGVMV